MDSIITHLKKAITLEHCAVRFLTAWCFICLMQTIVMNVRNVTINTLDYARMVKLPFMAAAVIILTVLLYIVYYIFEKKNEALSRKIEGGVLVASVFLYACVSVLQNNDIYFVVAMSALTVMAVIYCIRYAGIVHINMSKKSYIIIMAVSGGLYILFVSFCMVTRYLSYGSPNFDMGLFSQMFYYMKTTGTMKTTSERDYLLSHMCVHVSPVFYLILPFYMIFSSPVALEIIQPVIIAAAVIPLALICRHRKLSGWETALIIIIYCLYPVMSGGCFYDIHENMFFPLLLSTFLLFMEKDNTVGMCISAVLVWLIKEDASVLMMFVGLYMLLNKCMRKKGAVLFITSALYCLGVCIFLKYAGNGVMSGRYNNMIPEGDGNMFSVIKTAFANPAYLVTQIFAVDNITFIIQTMGVLLFLPLMTKKWSRYVLIGPYVLFNLVTDYQYMHSIYFHYVFGSGLLLIYLVIINLSDIDVKKRLGLIYSVVAAVTIFFTAYNLPKLETAVDTLDEERQQVYSTIDEGLSVIPDDASVIATTFLCAKLSQRSELYELYYTDKSAEYVAIDLRGGAKGYDVNAYLSDDRYEVLYYSDGIIAVFRDNFYKS